MNLIKKVLYGKKQKTLLLSAKENLQNENILDAISDYSKALHIDSKNEEALFNRGKAYFQTNHFKSAQNDFLALNAINQNYDPSLNYYLSKIFQKLGNTIKAAEFAEQYLNDNQDLSGVQYFTARAKFLNEEYDEALKLTDKLCNSHPEDFDIRYLRSLINFGKKDFVSAILDIDKAIEISAVNSYTFNLRGLININLEKNNEALEDFDYAIRLSPENITYYFNKARLLLNLEELTEAEKCLKNVFSLSPENTSARLLNAEINFKREKYSEALDDYEKLLENDPENQTILQRIIVLKSLLLDYNGAKENLTKALELDKDNSNYLYQLAQAEVKLNNYDVALEHLRKAAELDNENKEIIIRKGILEMFLEKYEESINTFEDYLKLDPASDKVKLYKAKALLKLGDLKRVEEELAEISEDTNEEEYFLINSQINFSNNQDELALQNIEKAIKLGNFDKSIYLIKNTLKVESGKLDEIEEIDDSIYDNFNKVNSQILNTIVCFEKGEYNTVKYQLSKLHDLAKDKEELLKPVAEFVESELPY